MEKDNDSNRLPNTKDTTKNPILILFYFAQDWMRPSPKQPRYLQVLVFIVKLPVLLLFLTVSPILLVFLFITFIAAV